MEDGRGKNYKMSRRMWEAVEAKAEEVRVAEAERRREKERGRKERRGERTKRKSYCANPC